MEKTNDKTSRMFCMQCEQTANGKACTSIGVCGKTAEIANLQDELTGALITAADSGADIGDGLLLTSLFAILTNVNFDGDAIGDLIAQVNQPAYDMELIHGADTDIRSLKTLILLGIRGVAAYACHVQALGRGVGEATSFIRKGLALITREDASQDELIAMAMECGKANLAVLEELDGANNEAFGTPEPTSVSRTVQPGPFIVVSGHDLADLKALLEQSEGKGVNVYTHGEMLPAHAYPGLKKHAHLKGNFGTAWQNQTREFDGVPAAVLFTTNCLMPPKASYSDRVFTTAAVGYPGLVHIGEGKDFGPVIAKAIELGGYGEAQGEGFFLTGFGHAAVLSHAETVISAVKSGAIKRFFLVGGCDGTKNARSYFTDFVRQTPKDSIVLTLACGKYRFNDLDLGEIGGLPRLMDMGQCNDAYSAVKVALALADAFECGVNDLPLTLVISWFEQKAVSILLSLLYLGIKNIRLGPSLPEFISDGVLNFLVENFGIKAITTAEADMAEILGTAAQ